MRASAIALLFAVPTMALPASALAQEETASPAGADAPGASTPAGAEPGADDADGEPAEEEPAGPVITELEGDEHVVLLPGTWVYTAPSVDAPRARWKAAAGSTTEGLAGAVVASALAESEGFVRIGRAKTGTHPCSGGFATPALDVGLWVDASALGQAVVQRVTVPGGGESSLTLNPGVLLAAGEDGSHLLRTWSTEVSATVPSEAVGSRFVAAEHLEFIEGDAGLPTAATISAVDGSFVVRVPKGEFGNVAVLKHTASAAGTELSMVKSCLAVRGLTQDAVGMKPKPLGGVIGGVLGRMGADDQLAVASGASLSWSDGSPAGQTTMDWWIAEAEVRDGTEGRSCTSWSPSDSVELGPEGMLTLCWSPEDDQTFAERQAAAGPPPEPIVLPERNPPKKAKLKGIAVPMDVEAHLAVHIAPAFTDQGPEKTQEYLKIAMVGKIKGLKQLEKYFAEQMIENPDDSDLVVMFAVLYEDMAASLLDSWVPPELDEQQSLVYLEALALKALPQCDKAFELYGLAGERARAASVPPRSLKTVSKALDRLRPDDRSSQADRMEACFRAYDW